MPPKPKNIRIHDVNPFLQAVREFLLGRKVTLGVRFQGALATRSPPLPILPEGPAHKVNSNYYFSRDGRREVAPPQIVAPVPKQLEGGQPEGLKRVTPGKVYQWD